MIKPGPHLEVRNWNELSLREAAAVEDYGFIRPLTERNRFLFIYDQEGAISRVFCDNWEPEEAYFNMALYPIIMAINEILEVD